MKQEDFENLIIQIVNESPGIKGTEFIKHILPSQMCFDLGDVLENLVNEKRICQIEYVLPSMDYRVKSIYFPIGTLLHTYNAETQCG